MLDLFAALSSDENLEVFWKLSLALLLGALLGLERIFAHKPAGVRTYSLVSMGSALFVVTSSIISDRYLASGVFSDPLRVASNILLGIGFLGAGVIIFKDSTLIGLTTAAGLWLSAGIGMATGFGLYGAAFLATILTLFIFTVLYYVEKGLLKLYEKEDTPVDR